MELSILIIQLSVRITWCPSRLKHQTLCNLEFSSNVWHSSLTKENRQDLERVQKAALKVILRNGYGNYENALKVSGLQSLDERRDVTCLTFAKNGFSQLINHGMTKRNSPKYIVKRPNTERLRKSSINYMQKQLNADHMKRKSEVENAQSELSKLKRMKSTYDSSFVTVNYV